MKAASGRSTGLQPAAQLAAEAVGMALERAGLTRADNVLLFLTRDHVRHAQPALVAAARAAGSLEVSGCTAYGLLTDEGWILDQPAAVALVIAHDAAPPATSDPGFPLLSFSGHATLPHEWQSPPARAGLLDTEAAAWAHGRLSADGCATARLPGLRARLAHSTGLRRLSAALTVDAASGYDLQRLAGLTASASLRRSLPGELRGDPPLHQIVLVRQPGTSPLAILAANADASLTLSGPLAAGDQVCWAIRQPLAAEQDMHQTLLAAVNPEKRPDFALMFSCLGRGPLFYGNDDRDLLAFRERFPATPLIGAYGSGQIAPGAGGNCLYQNSVVTLLCESIDV